MDQPGTTCPKCAAPSPCIDWNEVDIGVGTQTFDHEYQCPTHGYFAFVWDLTTFESKAVFRDEAESVRQA